MGVVEKVHLVMIGAARSVLILRSITLLATPTEVATGGGKALST